MEIKWNDNPFQNGEEKPRKKKKADDVEKGNTEKAESERGLCEEESCTNNWIFKTRN